MKTGKVRNFSDWRLVAFLVMGIFVITVPSAWSGAETVILQTAEHRLKLTVEIADTSATRSRGLMYRQDLPPMHGMLFDFNRSLGDLIQIL